ncbi:MAG: tRNA (adenosine(37)-N6)-threonylcarbamoyltransferase complex dimerization subunit type 1 TsaB [Gaiellales bacterium]
MTTACVTVEGDVMAESATRGRSTGAQRVLADISHLLAAAGLEIGSVGAIVCGRGPGTFTGLRIGLATARGLGFGLGVPVTGVSTLDALLHGDGVQVACIDARRGEVFAAGAGIEPCVLAPEELGGLLAPGTVVAGDGAIRHRVALAHASVPPDASPLHVPWARHHAALIGRSGSPEPIYLRRPDADRSLAAGAAR